jgi:glycosyltransferase involved in cell wall biosynthesis
MVSAMDKPWRILQLVPALNEGGVEQGTLDMAHYGTQQGAKMYVASRGGGRQHELGTAITHLTLPLHQRMPWMIWRNAQKLATYIKAEQIDLLHARSRGPAWSAWLASRWTGIPLVTTYHGTHMARHPLKKLYNSIMVRGRLTVAISEFIFEHILSTYPWVYEKMLRIAPRGANPDVFNPELYSAAQRQELRATHGAADPQTPVLLLPGRLTSWKGQLDLLQALVPLADQPWVLWLAGGGKPQYRAQIMRFIEQQGWSERVFLLGSRRDLPLVYAAADVVISASNRPEAFGRVAVEGQMMGKPVLATNHGGSRETVQHGHSGWLVMPGSIRELSNALDTVLQQRDTWIQLGAHGRAFVLEHYTTAQTLAAEWAVYEEILA